MIDKSKKYCWIRFNRNAHLNGTSAGTKVCARIWPYDSAVSVNTISSSFRETWFWNDRHECFQIGQSYYSQEGSELHPVELAASFILNELDEEIL